MGRFLFKEIKGRVKAVIILKDQEIVKVEKQQYTAYISGPVRGILNRITVGVTHNL